MNNHEHAHADCQPGLQMDQAALTFTELTQPDGITKYWKVEQAIGYIFGSEVEGGIEAFGSTKEIALDNLKKESEKLYESLWV